MAELIHAKNLTWRHLHRLEDPFFARSDVESAVKTYTSPGMAPNRRIANFQRWLEGTRLPVNDLNRAVLNSLDNGASYYVHHDMDKPTRPLVYWNPSEASSNSYQGVNGSWEVHAYVPAPLCNKLRIILKDIEPIKPMSVYKIPEEIIQDAVPVSYISLNERHMFALEVEGENDTPIPENKKITLVGFNKKQNTVPVEEDKKLEQEVYSQIFRAKQGDHFEVFVIPERMTAVKQDLKDNRNLQKSVREKSISPLKIVDNYTRADDVIVHVAKYVIPENRMLIIHREFGAHNSNMPLDEYVLQHEDSDWIQTIEVNSSLKGDQLSRVKDGWYELTFENLPRSGKFSLYSTPVDRYASSIVLFQNIDYAELTTNIELEQAEIAPPEEDEIMSDQPSASQLRDEGLEALFG